MGPTWGPSGADRTQVGPVLAPWTLLSGHIWKWLFKKIRHTDHCEIHFNRYMSTSSANGYQTTFYHYMYVNPHPPWLCLLCTAHAPLDFSCKTPTIIWSHHCRVYHPADIPVISHHPPCNTVDRPYCPLSKANIGGISKLSVVLGPCWTLRTAAGDNVAKFLRAGYIELESIYDGFVYIHIHIYI